MMTLTKPLAAAAVIVLGLALAEVTNTRHAEDKAQPTATPHQSAVSAYPQGSGNQQAPAAQAADHFSPALSPAHQAQRVGAMPQYGYRTAPDGYMSGSIYGSLSADDGPGPTVYWAPGRWYPYPGFGDKRVFMPPPEGVWGR